ncbi:MAG: murE 2 [Pseudonocardiales bacterium]|nr:murE 2 [Pseudonocardiales bacterium]
MTGRVDPEPAGERLSCASVPDSESASLSPRPRKPVPVELRALASTVGATYESSSPRVSGITAASADVRPGDLFAALPGAGRHGIAYLDEAIARGALAVMTDPEGLVQVAGRLPALVVDDARASLAPVSAQVYGYPSRSLRIVGITGTSGKTTTSFLVRAGLSAAGRESALFGTVGTFLGDEELPAALTTPESPQLQALLAVMVERGIGHLVMEVSSHALSLHRADSIEFAVAAFTNLSQDHLDFHRDMDDYFDAKARLFDGRAERAVVMVDDVWGTELARRVGSDHTAGSEPGKRVVTVRTSPGRADWSATEPVVASDGSTSFTAIGPTGEVACGSRIPGRYNDANALLALAILTELGLDPALVAPAVTAAQVPGRMERIDAGQDFLAVVDYSHKPAAVTGALRALRPLTRNRLIIALGCGGDRDRGKRPLMGAAASREADVLLVTDDNPRSEDPAAIRAQMLVGAMSVPDALRGDVIEIGDRRTAINQAVAIAQTGDTVLIAGKGHETGQEIAGRKYPFDDREILRVALTSRMHP